MRCCVATCKNDSRSVQKSDGITFHTFPRDPTTRSAWLEAISRPGWNPKEKSAICSKHFLSCDIYKTKNGFCRVKPGGIPLDLNLKVSDNQDCKESASQKTCRICLVTDMKMYPLNKYKLSHIYETVSGLPWDSKSEMPQKLCIECAILLIKFYSFKSKCSRSYEIMKKLTDGQCLTISSVNKIHRENYNLKSKLVTSDIYVDHFDLTIIHDDEITDSIDVKTEFTEVINQEKTDDESGGNEEFNIDDNDVEKENTVIEKEKKFDVKSMTPEQITAGIESRKQSSNFKNNPYRCELCFKGFNNEVTYDNHTKLHTSICGDFECGSCHLRYNSLKLLRQHIINYHWNRYDCKSCRYETTSRYAAKLHLLWHKGKKYECSYCRDLFDKKTTYLSHLRRRHPTNYICELCGNVFISSKGLYLHKKFTHRGVNKLSEGKHYCELCDVNFASKNAYDNHILNAMRHQNLNDKAYSGVNHPARNTTKKQSARKTHPIFCEQCDREMTDFKEYHRHFCKEHPDKNRTVYMQETVMCEICGRFFQTYAKLKEHKYTHTGENPYKCIECPKSFPVKARLVNHLRFHTKIRPFSCSTCNKAFASYSNFKQHMTTHSTTKAFKCDFCEKSFKSSKQTRAHVKYVHYKVPWPKRNRARRPEVRNSQVDWEEEKIHIK